MTSGKTLGLFGLLLLATTALVWARADNPTDQEAAGQAPVLRPGFSLPDPQGKTRDISEWDGKLIVLNFWATWCGPCREEMPLFAQLQEKYLGRNVQFIGVAIDNREAVSKFQTQTPVNYPLLVGDFDAIDLARDYGNSVGALPYTVIIDQQQRVRHTHLGAIEIDTLEALLEALL